MAKAKLIRRVPSNIPPRGPFANANIQEAVDTINSIDDSNVEPDAAIQRSKLANSEPNQIAFQNETGAPFTVTSTTKVTNLNADQVDGRDAGGANGLATLDASGDLVQDAKTLSGKMFAAVSVSISVSSGASIGSDTAAFTGFTSVDVVLPAVQNASGIDDAERPFDVGVDDVSATGCTVSVSTSSAVAADRSVTVALLVYGS